MNPSSEDNSKLKWMWISIFIFIFAPITWLYFNLPRGEDVQNAIAVKVKIERIIAESNLSRSKDTNIVLMQHARNELITVIQNPSPNATEVFKRIENRRYEIKGKKLKIVFTNHHTEKISVMYLNLSQ